MTKLGLPFEYQKFPEYFDAFNGGEDTESKNVFIEKILKKHGVKTILDMTCGTGSQVFFHAKRGYQITGSDFSPDLLKMARKKAKQENLDLKFIDGDMRTLHVGHFDAVITIDNAVGHLTKFGFEKAMKNINKNLNVDGLYVFDILNLNAMTDEVVHNLSFCTNRKVGNTQILKAQCHTIDRKTGLLGVYDSIIIQRNAEKPKSFNHKLYGQIYNIQQLQEMLSRTGFEIIEQYGMDGSPFIEDKTQSMLIVAKKVR